MSHRPDKMEASEIFARLPHRYPFCLLDRVLSLADGPDSKRRLGRKAVAIKNITMNEPYFPGHFPGNPMMPGVLQIEAVAQACAISSYRDEDPPQDFAIVGVDEAKFRRVVLPGDTLEIRVETIKEKGKILVFRGESFVNGQLANEMVLTAYVSERKI
ncbi:MAG: hypothetical protein A4S09_12645 [Proteobacteria bacterium SG_bin7]|nr:MAG: hypothetical protein A4S09_12645 [Proteobacteria bacterium SG_bin7]